MAIQSDYLSYRQNTRVSPRDWYNQPKNWSDDIATFTLGIVIYFILNIIILGLLAIIYFK